MIGGKTAKATFETQSIAFHFASTSHTNPCICGYGHAQIALKQLPDISETGIAALASFEMPPSNETSNAPDSPTSPSPSTAYTPEIDLGTGRQIVVVSSESDLPDANASGPQSNATQSRARPKYDLFCSDADFASTGQDFDASTIASDVETVAAAEQPAQMVCVAGSDTHVEALTSKVSELERELEKYRKELGSAEKLHETKQAEQIGRSKAAHIEHASHFLESSFGSFGAEVVYIEKADEATTGRTFTRNATAEKLKKKKVTGKAGEEATEIRWRDVVYKRPVVQQYFHNNKLHRQAEEHKT